MSCPVDSSVLKVTEVSTSGFRISTMSVRESCAEARQELLELIVGTAMNWTKIDIISAL